MFPKILIANRGDIASRVIRTDEVLRLLGHNKSLVDEAPE